MTSPKPCDASRRQTLLAGTCRLGSIALFASCTATAHLPRRATFVIPAVLDATCAALRQLGACVGAIAR
eukprot:4184888-Pleurochrysis_carterae.AAC.1